MPLPWPECYDVLKAEIVKKWMIKDDPVLLREFSDGKSTARVFEVDLRTAKHKGTAILS